MEKLQKLIVVLDLYERNPDRPTGFVLIFLITTTKNVNALGLQVLSVFKGWIGRTWVDTVG